MEDGVDEFVKVFMEEMKIGKGLGGWLVRGYLVSYCVLKMVVNGYMSVVVCEVSNCLDGEKVYVNSFIFGYISIDMISSKGYIVEEGVMIGVWLVFYFF